MTAIPLLMKVDIFISSPSDVGPERNAIKWAIEFLNRAMFIAEGYLLFPLAYEELVPPLMGQPAQIIVDHYMLEPDQCYMLICVLWTRMGTSFTHPRTNQEYQSGTDYEFTKAYEANKRTGKPLVLLYRRELGNADTGDLAQREKVATFFGRFGSGGGDFAGLYQRYSSLEEFRDLVLRNVVEVMHRHPPEGTLGSVERPAMIEEERRLDAAIPKSAQVHQPTELWVQLCVPNSPGFRSELPKERISELELSQKDISEQSLGVAFPVDPKTGLPKSTVLSVEVVAPDFELRTPQMTLEVVHGRDSARLLFSMVPKTERAKSIVHVHVKQRMPEGVEVVIASAALFTEIVTAETISPVWSVIRYPLRTLQSLLSSGAGLLPGEWAPTREHQMIRERFRIVSKVGEGGMGVVYLAESVTNVQRVAIKSFPLALRGVPDFRRRFFEEAKKQAVLYHPNIVQVLDFFEESGEFFLVMEYVDGQDLSRLIKSKGKLAESEALTIVRDILRGLEFAHAKGLVHRDIKPSNVLVDESGRARINFGIAIMAGGSEKSLTAMGAIGSPWYMSPEQILRPRDVDQRTDIYALGIVLYEMLTGSVPFDGETDFGVKELQVGAPAPDPREKNSEISQGVAQIVFKAIAKDPGHRFQNCHDFIEALDAIKKPGPQWLGIIAKLFRNDR